jgi:hypothetical protein
MDSKYPKLYNWFKLLSTDPLLDGTVCEGEDHETGIPDVSSFKGKTPARAFFLWLDDFDNYELGKKPPLELPLYKL